MGWKDLLQTDESITVPWVGGKKLHTKERTFSIKSKFPPEFGWHIFTTKNRDAKWISPADADENELITTQIGYLIGDRLVPDNIRVDPNTENLSKNFEPVFLIEPGLDRFVRISAGRIYDNGPLIFKQQEMPLGPEDQVLEYFLDQKLSTADIPGVAPALDAAFRFETWLRDEAEKRRKAEQERREKEERRRKVLKLIGDAGERRKLAEYDFKSAAQAALLTGGAQYLDHRKSYSRNEMVVRFRYKHRRFECTCDKHTLRIIDSGICLDDHAGTKGDDYFTLESLPAVIQEAMDDHKLVVYRHVD